MTLRDYFAAKAMQGFAANPDKEYTSADFFKLSQWAYGAADSMLAARSGERK